MIPIKYRGTSDERINAFCDYLQKKIATWVNNGYVGDGRWPVVMDNHARSYFTQLNAPNAIKNLVNKSPSDIRTYITEMERIIQSWQMIGGQKNVNFASK